MGKAGGLHRREALDLLVGPTFNSQHLIEFPEPCQEWFLNAEQRGLSGATK